ncbi:hypothetical protein Bca4012_080894 [Brassica carinata]
MAEDDTPPRFFKVFISHHSSDFMMIPISYNDELPRTLPKTAILQGTGGCFWKVEMKRKRDEVHFGKGWNKFVTDNSLTDGDFLTFVYNGANVFEVSIYGLGGCKEMRAVTEVEEVKEDSVVSLSSTDSDTNSKSEVANTISKNKGKSQVVEVEDESEEAEAETCSESTVAKTTTGSRNKGKKKEKVVGSSNEDSDSDYTEANEDSESDDTEASDQLNAFSESSNNVAQPKKKRERVTIKKIKDPEKYLVDPKNVFFETNVKNRPYELLVSAQLVKDYDLKFKKLVYYTDYHKDGKLQAKTTKWKDNRVCIKKWNRICKRNKLKKGDGILCELKRKEGFVYAREKIRAIAIFALGLCILDVARDTLQGPCRAFLADLAAVDAKRTRAANAFYSFFMAVRNVLGYAAGSYTNLHIMFPFAMTNACDTYCANLKSCFLLSIILLLIVTVTSLWYVKDKQWSPPPVNPDEEKTVSDDPSFGT